MAALRINGLVYIVGLVSGIILSVSVLTLFSPSRGSNGGSFHVEHRHAPHEDAVVNRQSEKQSGEDTHDHAHEHVEPLRTNERARAAYLQSGQVQDSDSRDEPVGREFHDESHHAHDQSEIAEALAEKVRLLCWVMTSPENHKTRAVHILATWGKRCNKIMFVSEQDDKTLPILKVDVKYGREHLTAKTMAAFDHIYKDHIDEADWFLKADDDTYVIVENMRYFLSGQNASTSIYFGHHFIPYVKQGYFSGGGGYVLSREALRRFGTRPAHSCTEDQGAEDVEIGKCMESVGVVTGDSRDNLGRSRFHCFNPETHVHGGYPDWYLKYDKHGAKKGIESISDYAITFHYVSVEQLYNLEFYIYHLRPYGIVSGLQDLNKHPHAAADTAELIGDHRSTPTNATHVAASDVAAKRRTKRDVARSPGVNFRLGENSFRRSFEGNNYHRNKIHSANGQLLKPPQV